MTKNYDYKQKLLTMKNKKLLLIILGVFSLLSLQAMPILHLDSPTQSVVYDRPPNYTDIELNGSFVYNHGPNAVEAYADGDFVYICFNQNFGYVNIIIMTELGVTIYDNTINTAVQSTCIIPISGFNTGTYTLILNDANDYAEGDFIKQ